MTIVLLVVAALILAYANGANDNFKAVATIYGSSTLGYRAALMLGTAAQVCGSVASVFLASSLLTAFSGKGLVPDATVADPAFLTAVATGATVTVLIATRIGMPVSTTHALIGGLLGAGLALSPAPVQWSSLGGRFVLPLLISPLLAASVAAAIYPVARAARKRLGVDEVTCICLAKRVEPVAITDQGVMVHARTGVELTADQQELCVQRYQGKVIGVSAQRIVDSLHLSSGFALGFARGLNDTPKVMALLIAAAWSGLETNFSLFMIAAAMAFGGVIHSRRIATTMGKRITEMNHGQGFVANLVASTMVIAASIVGLGVSTTHVSTASIFGIGLWTGKAHWNVAGQIITAWLATMPLGMLLAFTVAVLLFR